MNTSLSKDSRGSNCFRSSQILQKSCRFRAVSMTNGSTEQQNDISSTSSSFTGNSNINSFRLLSRQATFKTGCYSFGAAVNRNILLNEQSIKYMKEHPSTKDGKAIRNLLFLRICNDPMLFHELQSKLRKGLAGSGRYFTNEGAITALLSDSTLLYDMASKVLSSNNTDDTNSASSSSTQKAAIRSRSLSSTATNQSSVMISPEDVRLMSSFNDSNGQSMSGRPSSTTHFFSGILSNKGLLFSNAISNQRQQRRGTRSSNTEEYDNVDDDYGWRIVMERQKQAYVVVNGDNNNNKGISRWNNSSNNSRQLRSLSTKESTRRLRLGWNRTRSTNIVETSNDADDTALMSSTSTSSCCPKKDGAVAIEPSTPMESATTPNEKLKKGSIKQDRYQKISVKTARSA